VDGNRSIRQPFQRTIVFIISMADSGWTVGTHNNILSLVSSGIIDQLNN
jgi:hypothetical protein